MMVNSAFLVALSLLLLAPVPQPKPKDPNAPTLAEIRAGFGQKYNHITVRKFGQRLGPTELTFATWMARQDSDQETDTAFFWAWRGKGISAQFQYEKLDIVWLYNEGEEGHREYGGALPEGLTFNDTPEQAMKKLGPPEGDSSQIDRADKAGSAVIGVETNHSYPSKGLDIVLYKPNDGPAKLIRLAMFAPTTPKPGDRR